MGQGTDHVTLDLQNYTLGLNVENLTLGDGDTANLNETNALDNLIQGSEGNNVINGAGGNDTIYSRRWQRHD